MQGEWESPIIFQVESLYFCYLDAHPKFQNPNLLLGDKERPKRERREKITPLIAAAMFARLGPNISVDAFSLRDYVTWPQLNDLDA